MQLSNAAYTYDQAGNRTSESLRQLGTLAGQNPELLTTLTYDAAGQLSTETRPESTSTYQRDALGRLTVSTQTTAVQERSTTYTWDGLTLSGQTDNIHGATSYLPDAFGRTTGQTATPANPNGSLLLADNLNSTLAMATPTGTINQVADWGTFGAFDAHTAGWDTTIGYTSQATNPATGTVSFYARNYDPTTATFTTVDQWEGLLDLPETLNNYAYVLGTPLSGIDVLGYWPSWVKSATSWAAGVSQGAVNNMRENWRTYAGFAASVVVGIGVMTLATACVAATAGLCLIGVGAAAGGASALTSYMFTGDDGQGTLSWSGGLKAVGFGATIGALTGPFAGTGIGITQALKTSQVSLSHSLGTTAATTTARSVASSGVAQSGTSTLKTALQVLKPKVKGPVGPVAVTSSG